MSILDAIIIVYVLQKLRHNHRTSLYKTIQAIVTSYMVQLDSCFFLRYQSELKCTGRFKRMISPLDVVFLVLTTLTSLIG